jgi:hypothetical protein
MPGILVLFVLLVTPALRSISFADNYSSMSKIIMYEEHGAELLIIGRWEAVADTGYIIPIPKTNTVNIVCDQETMTCTESLAMFYGPDEIEKKPYGDEGRIVKVTFEYQVVEWTTTALFARLDTGSTDIGLRISLPDERVERTCREKGNPDVYRHWILE